jgi:hypothetical protein
MTSPCPHKRGISEQNQHNRVRGAQALGSRKARGFIYRRERCSWPWQVRNRWSAVTLQLFRHSPAKTRQPVRRWLEAVHELGLAVE